MRKTTTTDLPSVVKAYSAFQKALETHEKATQEHERLQAIQQKEFIEAKNSEKKFSHEDMVSRHVAVLTAEVEVARCDTEVDKARLRFESLIRLFVINGLRLDFEAARDLVMKLGWGRAQYQSDRLGGYVDSPRYQGTGGPAFIGNVEDDALACFLDEPKSPTEELLGVGGEEQ